MIRFQNTRVASFSREYLDVFWEIAPTNEDIQEYEFYVERSESETGDYTRIAGPLIDQYFLRDNSVPQISTTRTFFYRVEARHVPTGRIFSSPIVDRTGTEDLIALEMIRREELIYFQEHAGIAMWVFPRRTFGMRCPQCYDPVTEKRIDDSCPTCFGTTFAGGYRRPFKIWGQISPPEDSEQVTVEDHRQQKYFQIRAPPTPDIKPLDIIVDYSNRRFRVFSRGGTSKHGLPIRLEMKAIEIQKGSIEDAIPLNIDHSQETFFPPRNFTNPHNLEDVGRSTEGQELDFGDILDLYRY